jgi:hypothetical protein
MLLDEFPRELFFHLCDFLDPAFLNPADLFVLKSVCRALNGDAILSFAEKVRRKQLPLLDVLPKLDLKGSRWNGLLRRRLKLLLRFWIEWSDRF